MEVTYGLERIGMFLNHLSDVFDLAWSASVSYRDLRHRDEVQFSRYNFEVADIDLHFGWFNDYEKEAGRLIEMGLILPAYDYCLKCSHTFNVLDARGAISVSERTQLIQRVRSLACRIAQIYVSGNGHS